MTKAKPDTQPSFDPNRNDFRRKLGYYLTGLAIGLVLLGMLQMARRAAVNAPAVNAPAGGAAPPPANSQMAK